MTKTSATMMMTMMTTTSKAARRAACSGTLALVALFGVGGIVAAAVSPSAAFAQGKKEPTVRTVTGTVEDKSGKPIDNAVVYIKDTKTLSVKSYLTNDQGEFHFTQLSMSSDYDVWAELNGKRSKTHSISMFNSKTTLTYTLKVED
ncbi:MAG: carboxypeptidase-like regulatory domain-containing protein [Acidobacteriaceae bacterium]|nr:carboxypeptidase-like regulatory domain-containing protein [Acidobacteriaceae bacterium]